MVHAMAKDRGKLPRVAWFLAVMSFGANGACGPRVRPDVPFPEEPVVHRERAPAPQPVRPAPAPPRAPQAPPTQPAAGPQQASSRMPTCGTSVEIINASVAIATIDSRQAIRGSVLTVTSISGE